jgi:hypothetical protein
MGDEILQALNCVLESDRAIWRDIRRFSPSVRPQLAAAQLRNTALALSIIRTALTQPAMIMNIPISIDASGNFFDRVPVIASPEQITAATERQFIVPQNTTCSICQDTLTSSTRIRACGHTFHAACLDQWLQMNPRCPECRHDIRDLQSTANPTSNE